MIDWLININCCDFGAEPFDSRILGLNCCCLLGPLSSQMRPTGKPWLIFCALAEAGQAEKIPFQMCNLLSFVCVTGKRCQRQHHLPFAAFIFQSLSSGTH